MHQQNEARHTPAQPPTYPEQTVKVDVQTLAVDFIYQNVFAVSIAQTDQRPDLQSEGRNE